MNLAIFACESDWIFYIWETGFFCFFEGAIDLNCDVFATVQDSVLTFLAVIDQSLLLSVDWRSLVLFSEVAIDLDCLFSFEVIGRDCDVFASATDQDFLFAVEIDQNWDSFESFLLVPFFVEIDLNCFAFSDSEIGQDWFFADEADRDSSFAAVEVIVQDSCEP